MKAIRGTRRTTSSGFTDTRLEKGVNPQRSQRDFLRFRAPDPGDDLQSGYQDRGEQRRQHADAEGDGEAFDRARAEPIKQDAGDQGRHMTVEDRAESAGEAGLQ